MFSCFSRHSSVFVLIVALLIFTGNAWGFDPASVYPENGFLFARLTVKDLLPHGEGWNKSMPEFGRVFDKTTALLTEKIGFHPLRDLHEIGVFITSDVDFKLRKPNHIAFFARGAFKPEQIMAVLPDVLKGFGRKAEKLEIKDLRGRKILTGPDFMAFFPDNETLLAGSPDVIQPILEGKLNLGKAPEDVKPTLSKAVFFLSADVKTLKEKSQKVQKDIEKAPHAVKVHLESLQKIVFFFENGTLNLKADFNKTESSTFAASTIEAFRSQGLLECESRLKKLEDGIEQATVMELLGEQRSQMLAFAAGKDLLRNLQTRANGASFEASFLVPEPLRNFMLGPGALPIVGVISAIAVPNFVKARNKARMANCYANQRILMGAFEMYNMDHETSLIELKDADGLEGGVLHKSGMLGSPINKPEPDCEYYSEGDLSKAGKIGCKKHGSVF